MEVEMVEWKGFLALSALHFLLAYLFLVVFGFRDEWLA